MDTSCHSSGASAGSSISTANASSVSSTTIPPPADTTARTTNTNKDHFLRHLNKLSHKISKPSTAAAAAPIRRPPSESSGSLPPPPQSATPLQQQPPVYNINKSDFRDVVQKLTGSPAHDRIQAPASPPPLHAPKPAGSRLQRIRPPPLVQLSNRPPPMLNSAVPPVIPTNPVGGGGFMRQQPPLSPLPPLPTCHAAAESPISAYMRSLRSSACTVDSDPKFNDRTEFNPQQMQQPINTPPASMGSLAVPPSFPFGCLPSPKSPCALHSPKLLLSPTGAGPLGLPLSPTVPGVPSPK